MSLRLKAIFEDVAQAQHVYRAQLSKQRLFVPHEGQPSQGTEIALTLQMLEPSATLEIGASVFRVIDAATAQKHSLGEVAGVVLDVPITEAIKKPLRAFLTGGPRRSAQSPRAQQASSDVKKEPVAAEVRSDVYEYLQKTEGKTHYEVLGLHHSVQSREIRRGYLKLMRKFHPDMYYRRIDEETQELFERAFQRVTQAFETLTDSRRRDRYDLEIGTVANDPLQKKRLELLRYREQNRDNIEKAKGLWLAALEDEKAGRLSAARNKIKLAKGFDPRNPVFDRKLRELSS